MTANLPKTSARGSTVPVRVPDVRTLPCPARPDSQPHRIAAFADVWGCRDCSQTWATLDTDLRATLPPSKKGSADE